MYLDERTMSSKGTVFVGTGEKFIMVGDEEEKAGVDVKSFIRQTRILGFIL